MHASRKLRPREASWWMHPGRQLRKWQDNAGKLYFSRFAQDSVSFPSNIAAASILMPHWNFPSWNLWVHIGCVSLLLFNFMANTSTSTLPSKVHLAANNKSKKHMPSLKDEAGDKHCSKRSGVDVSRSLFLEHTRRTHSSAGLPELIRSPLKLYWMVAQKMISLVMLIHTKFPRD